MHRLVIALVTLLGLTGASVVAAFVLLSGVSDRLATLAPAHTRHGGEGFGVGQTHGPEHTGGALGVQLSEEEAGRGAVEPELEKTLRNRLFAPSPQRTIETDQVRRRQDKLFVDVHPQELAIVRVGKDKRPQVGFGDDLPAANSEP